ncbi:MAG: cholesterol esterase [Peltula sp. TS41687]|nr:MAG: cholesterol esterase [Peltula sp. TS41687]
MCALYGYDAEEHIVQTTDGYLLGLHRLGWRKGEERLKVNGGPNSIKKKVVYLHHGLLMNSEVWVCITEPERCLPFQLVHRGYDVWLGNNRGNKYSKKSVNRSPTSTEFWNFSMDEFAFHDIPNSIAYILDTTGQPSLSYIGFSQGTAQAFASLSIHPKLNEQVDLFIALAPAMAPAGLSNGVVDALIKASPEVIFLAFGRQSILKSVTMWQTILYPPIFVRIIDICLSFLFNWSTRNISPHQKLAAYPHLYSFTSTKSIVHWFQIIRNQSFQMYDDDVQAPLNIGGSSKYYKVARFPTRNIKTPVMLLYGGSDSLVDIMVMLKQLPDHTVAVEIPHFEHLDFLWGNDVDKLVFPHIFTALEPYAAESSRSSSNKRLQQQPLPLPFRTARYSLNQPPSFSEDENTASGAEPGSSQTSNLDVDSHPTTSAEAAIPRIRLNNPASASPTPESPTPAANPNKHVRLLIEPHEITSPSTPPSQLVQQSQHQRRQQPIPPFESSLLINTTTTSTTTTAADEPSTSNTSNSPASSPSTPIHEPQQQKPRTSSMTSTATGESNSRPGSSASTGSRTATLRRPGFRAEGITLGVARAIAGGVVTKAVEGKGGSFKVEAYLPGAGAGVAGAGAAGEGMGTGKRKGKKRRLGVDG